MVKLLKRTNIQISNINTNSNIDGGEIHADASIFSQNQGTGISCPNKCVFKGTYQCGCTDC